LNWGDIENDLLIERGTIMEAILEQINSMGKAFVEFALPMLVQSSVLIAVLLGLDLILRRRIRAVFRYWIWMIVFLKLILPTTLSSPTSPSYWLGDDLHDFVTQEPTEPEMSETAFPGVAKGTNTPKLPEAASVPIQPVESIRIDHATPLPAVEDEVLPAAATPSVTWQGLVLLLWLAIVAAMGLLLVQRAFFVKGLIAQSEYVGAEIVEILERGRRQMGIHKRVALKLSPVGAGPSVCGLFRPTILIPQSLADKLDSEHLSSIVLHELAHIKRGDLWVSLFQTVLQIIYFYNPLLWVANAMIRKTREQAVDEMVLIAMGDQAEDYPSTCSSLRG
jgi:beta-lactamase regulating signal transducer with metallopeptidase domain